MTEQHEKDQEPLGTQGVTAVDAAGQAVHADQLSHAARADVMREAWDLAISRARYFDLENTDEMPLHAVTVEDIQILQEELSDGTQVETVSPPLSEAVSPLPSASAKEEIQIQDHSASLWSQEAGSSAEPSAHPTTSVFDIHDPCVHGIEEADIPRPVKQELMQLASAKSLSFYYLCAIYRRGVTDTPPRIWDCRVCGFGVVEGRALEYFRRNGVAYCPYCDDETLRCPPVGSVPDSARSHAGEDSERSAITDIRNLESPPKETP